MKLSDLQFPFQVFKRVAIVSHCPFSLNRVNKKSHRLHRICTEMVELVEIFAVLVSPLCEGS